MAAPRTVTSRATEVPGVQLSLDDAIRTGLANTEVIRVLAGLSASSSGRTIYDPAISNTQIDVERGRFDPQLEIGNVFTRTHTPSGVVDPPGPTPPRIVGDPRYDYNFSMGLSKTLATGGTAELNVLANPNYTRPTSGIEPPLNPQTPSAVELGITQPLLQGAGAAANLAPIVIARIQTERSYFQTKDSVQEMVRGVIEAYWSLVAARTVAWARREQVAQGDEALRREEARLRAGMSTAADVAQARSALADFRATLITAEAAVLDREAALRNILGLPPSEAAQTVPTSLVRREWLATDWPALVDLAEQQRPDIIELKLILEADQQRLILARNQALPQANAVAGYRWNGLEGRLPSGESLATLPGEFTGWQLGVNFSVPLGLRSARASMREQELLIKHDRANLEQGLHAAAHELAQSYRSLAHYYEQSKARAEAREAAAINLDQQMKEYRTGRPVLYLNVLQAIVNWGNAVSAEAQAITQYNIELANLERQTGTILETHGVRFVEERYGSIGPLGRLFADRPYPMDMRPCANEDRYPSGNEPAEQAFGLKAPVSRRAKDGDRRAAPMEPLPPVVPEPGRGNPPR